MIITLATERNIDHWMNLVNKVKESFPGLETQAALDEHRNTVLGFMDKDSAICAKQMTGSSAHYCFQKKPIRYAFSLLMQNIADSILRKKCFLICLHLWIQRKILLLRRIVQMFWKEYRRESFIREWDLLKVN